MTEHHLSNGIVFRTSDCLTAAGSAVHAFTTRFGGVSTGVWESLNLGTGRGDDPQHVEENYRRIAGALGVDPARTARTHQVHGDRIRIVDERGPFGICGEDCDALITDVPGVLLCVYTADCTPILILDPRRKAAAAVHAGWRGTVLQLAAKTVRQMTETYGSRPSDLVAAIGPSIAKCCFETHRDVPDAVLAAYGPEAKDMIFPAAAPGKYRVDLKRLNALSLQRAGVPAGRIEIDGACTACEPEKYWSHRVHGTARGNQCGLIALCG